MTRYKLLLIMFLFVSTMSNAADFPNIVVDEYHIGFSRPDNSEVPPYVISPSSGIIVIATKYQIEIPEEFGKSGPNAINLIMGKNQKYKVAWRGNNHRHELSATTLIPLLGSIPFTGFKSGDTAIIAIGNDHAKPNSDGYNLATMWLGMVKVK